MDAVADHTVWALALRAVITVKLIAIGVPVPVAVALAALNG